MVATTHQSASATRGRSNNESQGSFRTETSNIDSSLTKPVDPAQSLNASSWEDAAASPKPPGNKRKQSVLGDGQEPEDSDASTEYYEGTEEEAIAVYGSRQSSAQASVHYALGGKVPKLGLSQKKLPVLPVSFGPDIITGASRMTPDSPTASEETPDPVGPQPELFTTQLQRQVYGYNSGNATLSAFQFAPNPQKSDEDENAQRSQLTDDGSLVAPVNQTGPISSNNDGYPSPSLEVASSSPKPHESQSRSTQVLYDLARQARSSKTSSSKRLTSAHGRQNQWTLEEENSLLAAIDRVKGPHWAQILSMYGRDGSINETLKGRGQVQLKDKARNLKLFFLKSGIEMPYYLKTVTGDLHAHMTSRTKRLVRERQKKRKGDRESISRD